VSKEMENESITNDKIENNNYTDTINEDNFDKTIDTQGDKSTMDSGCGCNSKSGNTYPSSYVYALGRTSYIPPSPSIKYEIDQAKFRANIKDVSDDVGLKKLLTGDNMQENFYLARQLCWIFNLGSIETYIVSPASIYELHNLIEMLSLPPRQNYKRLIEEQNIDLVVGIKGPVSPPGMCANYILPMVKADQVQTYKISDILDNLYKTWYKEIGITEDKYQSTIYEIFSQMLELSNNEGATDENRALNFVILRAASIYMEAAKLYNKGLRLDHVRPKPVMNIGSRKIVEVLFYFRERAPGLLMETFSIKVDVTGEFPFLASYWSQYFTV